MINLDGLADPDYVVETAQRAGKALDDTLAASEEVFGAVRARLEQAL